MSEESEADIGGILRNARRQRGWSQATLGEAAGVSRPTVARAESGHDISTATLARIVAALGLTLKVEPPS